MLNFSSQYFSEESHGNGKRSLLSHCFAESIKWCEWHWMSHCRTENSTFTCSALSFFFSILQPATGCQLCKCENVYSSLTCATCFCLSLPADADNSHLFNCFTVAARLFNVHFVDVAHFVILQCLRRWCYATLNSDAVWLQHCIGQSICYLPMLNLCIKLTRWAKNKILIMCSLELYATHTERERAGRAAEGEITSIKYTKRAAVIYSFIANS